MIAGLRGFAEIAELETASELDRVILLSFFHLKQGGAGEFSSADATLWLDELHFAKPNSSRLRTKLDASRDVVQGSSSGYFKLHQRKLKALELAYPDLDTSEEVEHTSSILPEVLYKNTRGFVRSLGDQINASYEHNIFDGCAVLMRRLMEILLILSFEHNQVESEIKNADGTYMMLEGILAKAKNHPKLSLSRNSRESLEAARSLGNYSAHKIYYNCKREDIKRQAFAYRGLIEELLYKSGIRV